MMGWIFLIIATVSAAMFSIFFKIFELKGIDSLQAILFNYLTAFIWGFALSFDGTLVENPLEAGWLLPAIVMGFIFVLGMVLLSDSTRRVGVAISTVFSRASMVIPVIVSYLFISGSEKPRWLPILLVLVAMVLTIWTGSSRKSGRRLTAGDIMAPVIVFITFGLSNSILKIIQDRVSVARAGWPEERLNAALSLVTSCIFLVALLMCVAAVIMKHIYSSHPTRVTWKNILGGVGLGTANYFCTYMLMLAMMTIDSSVLFPIHNIGIVAIGAVAGWLCFKEKLRPQQIAGIVLAGAAIAWLCF